MWWLVSGAVGVGGLASGGPPGLWAFRGGWGCFVGGCFWVGVGWFGVVGACAWLCVVVYLLLLVRVLLGYFFFVAGIHCFAMFFFAN